ncbi:unnamed protein product [Effrenium voratum]|nr:unnamed protein product [Effrenium voratum]
MAAPDNFALDGTPVQLAKMPLAERSASTYPWLFEVGLPCTGESYCAPLADCYEACRLSGDFDEACWQSSCCPSATMREFNNSELNYYVCTFTHNSCLSRCNTHFKSRRCGKDGKTYCPALADCYEACRLDGRTGSCQDFPCCPAKVDGFNESTEKFFLCEHVGNTCLTSCNEEHGPYRYCDGRSHCKQLAGCYEECANFGLAPELCSSETSCCPVFGDADGTDGYLDPDLGYFTCDDGTGTVDFRYFALGCHGPAAEPSWSHGLWVPLLAATGCFVAPRRLVPSLLQRRALSVDQEVAERFWAKELPKLQEEAAKRLGVPYLPEPSALPSWAEAVLVVPHKVARDIEQLEYLVGRGVLGSELENYVKEFALPEFQLALQVVNQALEGTKDDSALIEPNEHLAVFFGLYGRLLHMHPGRPVKTDVLNPEIDFNAVQRDFKERRHRVVVIDDFFSDAALQQLRDFLLESTMWADVKRGYVGAYLNTGFACPLVAQVEKAIRQKLSDVLDGLELQNAWAYMYDGNLPGIGAHADDSQVQINIYLTPTEANLWASDDSLPAGGLVVYGVGPPSDWDFGSYNSESQNPEIKEILEEFGYWNRTIPYVQNRAVLFDSTYFHRSDDMSFREGYTNRRINLTFLYGKREQLDPAPAVK